MTDGYLNFDTKINTSGFTSGLKKLAGALAIGATVKAAVKAGMGFESAFAGVRKTVDATAEQLAGLKQGIRDMAKELPTSANEIAGVAEAAGQLGIETDNILGFTKTMTMLGDATNLTAEQAATTLARFANITGMSQDNFDRLGSSVVALGNNFATTEAEIADMAQNIASAGSQVGMSEPEIMGFAAALSSVGMEAAAGGTAISKLVKDMQLAVETGSENLQQFANVAGVSANEFSKAFRDNAANAVTKFFTGLNDTERLGKSAIAVLDDMGISEVRLSDAILRAAGSGDLFQKALETSKKAWEDNTALTKEAEQRYETLESQLGILKNHLIDLGISFYDGIQEPLKKAVSSAIDSLSSLTKSIQNGSLQDAVAGIGEAFGAIVNTVGKVASVALPPLISAVGSLGSTMNTVIPLAATLLSTMKAYSALDSITKKWQAATKVIQAHEKANRLMITATSGGLTTLQTGVSLLTGKISLLTAAKNLAAKAQNALNIAWSTNPIGVVVAGVAALTAGLIVLGNALIKETEEEKKSREERKKFLEYCDDSIEKSKELRKSISELSEKRKEDTKNTEAYSYANKKLTDQLFELSNKENKTISDKLLIKDIVDNLNQSIEGLNLQYDEEAGKLSLTKDQIYEVIKAKEQLALQNAAMEFLTETYKKQFELQAQEIQLLNDQKTIKEKIAETEEKISKFYSGDRSEDIYELNNALKEYSKELNKNKKELKELGNEQETVSKQIEVANKNLELSYNNSSNASKKSTNEIAIAWKECAVKYGNTSNEMLQAAQEFYLQMEKDAGSYGSSFISAWKSAIDSGAFLSCASIEEMFATVTGIMESGSEQAGEIGRKTPEMFSQEFLSKSSLMSNAAKESSTEATNVGKTTIESGAPSVGQAMGSGVAAGILASIPLVTSASSRMGQLALASARKSIDSHSPSKKFKEMVGKTIPQGVAVGIKENTYEVTDAVKQMFDDIKLQKELGSISEGEYYEKLREYRDQYLEESTKEWWDYTKELISYEEKLRDRQFKNLDWFHDNSIISDSLYYQMLADLRDQYFSESDEEWQDYTEKILNHQMDLINDTKDNLKDALEEAKNAFDDAVADGAEKMREFSPSLLKIKSDDGNGNITEYYRPNDYSYRKYSDEYYNSMMNMQGLIGMLEPGTEEYEAGLKIYAGLAAEDPQEAVKQIQTYLNMGLDDFINHIKQTAKIWREDDSRGADIYGFIPSLELEKAEDDMEQFEKKWFDAFGTLPDQSYNIGVDMMQSIINGALSQIENFKSQVVDGMLSVFNGASIGINTSAASPAAASSGGGNTYIINSPGSTIGESIRALKNQDTINRLRGY